MNANARVDPGPEDVDPTGVRELLAAMPDPGPMPDDVYARISASIQREQASRAGDESSENRAGATDGTRRIAPLLHRERPRLRRSWLALGGIAAGVAVVALAGSLLVHQRPESSTNSAAVAPGQASGNRSADLARTQLHIQLSSTDYTAATLAEQARSLLAAPASTIGRQAPASAAVGPISTPPGLATCLGALNESDPDKVSADIATFAGQPAAVIVVTKGATSRVYAVHLQCGAGDPAIIEGPVPVS